MDTQFNLTQIYLTILINIVVEEKGTVKHFKKVGNRVPDTILVERDF